MDIANIHLFVIIRHFHFIIGNHIRSPPCSFVLTACGSKYSYHQQAKQCYFLIFHTTFSFLSECGTKLSALVGLLIFLFKFNLISQYIQFYTILTGFTFFHFPLVVITIRLNQLHISHVKRSFSVFSRLLGHITSDRPTSIYIYRTFKATSF